MMTPEQFAEASAAGKKLWEDMVAFDRVNHPEDYKACGHRRCPCETGDA